MPSYRKPDVIQVRAKITAAEWEALRILALRQNRTTADLIGAAIRSTFPNLTTEGNRT